MERLCQFVERFDKLTRLRRAAEDMKLALLAARDLASRRGAGLSEIDRVLESGLVVTYARPYLESSIANLGRRWWPTDPSDRLLHDRLIETLRHPQHAHSDLSGARRLVRTAPDDGGAPSIVRALTPGQELAPPTASGSVNAILREQQS